VFVNRVVAQQHALLLLAVAICLSAGCSDGRPTRVPVAGKVLIDGKPLALGYIRFIPDGARASGGEIGPDGRFVLTCYDGTDGAVIGTHRIEVTACEVINPNTRRWHVPKKYGKHDTSGLSVEVKEPTDSLVIDLSWDGGAPFIERTGTEPTLR